ncbi:MAG TPA: PLP-dependent aminotransferase family protein [Propionibacteriaceae bacterium]
MKDSWTTSGLDLHLDLTGRKVRASLEQAMREVMQSGRLSAGTRLPSTRALATDLGIARNTVTDAYAQLVAEGWLVARQGSGTLVADRVERSRVPSQVTTPMAQVPPRYDLSPGAPDVSAFPRSTWLAAARRALDVSVAQTFGYVDTRGLLVLREALADYLARVRGVDVQPERLVVCSGFSHGLDLVSQVLAGRGTSAVAVEPYGHASHRAVLARHGLESRPLGLDDGGAVLGDLSGVGAMLLTPAHQFPIGTVLAADRRREAVDWAVTHQAYVIEDDYDGEFRYDRHPVGAMQPLAPEQVIYAGTASKTLAPGLRMGWLVLPVALVDDLILAQRESGVQNSTLDQLTFAELLLSGAYDRHVRRSRSVYRRRRDHLVTALREEFPEVRVSGIAAGLHLLVELPEPLEEAAVVACAAGRGLVLQGLGDYATRPNARPPALVVGYGRPPDHDYTSAVSRLLDSLLAARKHRA